MKNEYKSLDEMYQERVKLTFRFIHKFSIPMIIISFIIYFQNQGTGIESGAGFWSVSLKFWIVVFIIFTFALIRITKVEAYNEEKFREQEEERKKNIINNVTNGGNKNE